jgi:YesN/AraC family two-component response regulator
MGISAEELPKIFDMFYQADGSSTREQQGSGIGLALTKELIELHRGKINVDSKEGEWTEVQIELPLGREHLKDEEIIDSAEEKIVEPEISVNDYSSDSSEEPELEKIGSEKDIVLVVEDNTDVREYIKDSINKDYDVVEAINGEQGLRKAEKYIPDLIIGDIMMPKMDGYEMTKRIKQDEKTSHIPVILLTAKSDKESKLEGLELGADDYLTKPFDTKELLARMKNLIEGRKLLHQKFTSGTFEVKSIDKPNLSAIDEKFIEKILTVINEHLSEEEFSIEDIAMEIGMSRAQIYRKIKALTGKSPSLYLRSVRLSKAKEMIRERKGTISEISYRVGFSSPAYFSRCYREEFGHPPSEQN